MWRESICLAIVMALSVAAHAQVVNLVENPSFEEDEEILNDAAYERWWTWGWEQGLNSTVAIDETESIDGDRSLRIDPQGGVNWHFIVANSPIPMQVDTEYTASFWVKAETPRALTAKMKATDNSVDWGLTDFEVTTEWAEYYMTSAARSDSTKIEFHCAAVDTPLWLDFVNVYEGEYVAGIGPTGAVSPEKAARPNPADGAVIDQIWTELTWKVGSLAVSHNVYISEDLEAVSQGQVEALSTTDASLVLGQTPPYATGLTPGQTYYWRVDEVNNDEPDSPWTGDVWSFRVRPLTAWNPMPGDGLLYVAPDQDLMWAHGMGNMFHTVYFGETFEAVNEPTAGGWMTLNPAYDPGPMEIGKTYYWRVDEYAGTTTHKGDVWSFTTVPDVAVTDPEMVGWWTLDEGMGSTAVDWSGHANHGQIIGSAEWTYGAQGGALYLADGSHVEIPAPKVNTNTMTMTAWAKRDGVQSDWAAILFSRDGSAVSGMGFGPANELRYHWTDKYWDFATGIVPPDQEWFFMALVVEPTQATLYYNGTDTMARNEAAHDPDPFDGPLRIGQDRPGRDLQGGVDDVRFYSKALTEAQITAVMRRDLSLAWNPAPPPDAIRDIRDVKSLAWSAGDGAVSHDVYLGASREAVAGADNASSEYQGNQTAASFSLAGIVDLNGGDYFWRIDEIEADGAVQAGAVWGFTVLPYLLVDDFESYDDDIDAGTAIFQTWIDGVENGTGSYVGYEIADNGTFGETRVVHGGGQSMPLQYDNTAAPGHSQADRTFATAQDWTAEGVTTLVVHFRGAPDNTGQLYAEINGTKVAYTNSADDIAATKWIAWSIDLASVGVNLERVETLTIGIEGGAAGMLYVDDIRLTKSQ